MSLDCFKAYDVRGRIPDQLNEDIARRIGRAYAEVILSKIPNCLPGEMLCFLFFWSCVAADK